MLVYQRVSIVYRILCYWGGDHTDMGSAPKSGVYFVYFSRVAPNLL